MHAILASHFPHVKVIKKTHSFWQKHKGCCHSCFLLLILHTSYFNCDALVVLADLELSWTLGG
jgi:hypothetical protein